MTLGASSGYAARRARHALARPRVVSARALAPGARGGRAALPDLPRAGARRAVPVVVTVHDLAVFRHPEVFPRWTRDVQHARRPARASQRAAHRRRLRVHRGASSRRCCACRARRSASCRTPSTRSSRPTGRARTATTSSPSARSSRARTSRASSRPRRRLGVELRVVGARGWGDVEARGDGVTLARRGRRRRACAALPRRAAASRIRRSTRASGSRSLEAMACGAPVVTSAGGATEEIAGGAAVLVDPLDPAAIAAGHRGRDRAPRRAARARARARARLLVGRRGPRTRSRSTARRPRERSARRHRRRRARPPAHRRRDVRRAAARARFPAVGRRPALRGDHAATATLVPPGVEPIELPARFQELRMAVRVPLPPASAAAGARALRPLASARAVRVPACSRCRISRSSATAR